MDVNYGKRTIYVRNNIQWDLAQQVAKSQGMSMSEFLEHALENMLKPNSNSLKIQQIRRILSG